MARSSSRVTVPIDADTSGLRRGTRSAEDDLNRLQRSGNKSLDRLKTAALGAGVAITGGLVTGLFKSVEAAREAEVAQAKMVAQLRASGISFKAHGDEIDRVIQKHARLAAVDDEDLQGAFTNIVRATGDLKQSLGLVGLAADLARAKNLDLAKAGDLIGKVAKGNTSALSRYGIVLDKNATATEALAALQERFAGQGEAYGKTTAGAIDRAKNAAENLAETVGQSLAPHIEKAANAAAKFIDGMRTGRGEGGKFAATLKDIADKIKPIVDFFVDHPKLIAVAVGAWATYKTASLAALAAIKVKTFRAAFMKSVPAAATAGTAAGTAMAASTTTAAAAGMGSAKGKSKFRGAAMSIGRFMGPLIAVPLAIEIAQAIERKFNPGGITAADLGNQSKGNVENLLKGMGWTKPTGPNTPRSTGTDRSDAAQSVARASRVPGSDPGGGAGSVRPRGTGTTRRTSGSAGSGSVTGDAVSAEMGRRLRAMSAGTSRAIYVQSGLRTMEEQAALVEQKGLYGPGNPTGAAAPSPNAPHIRGVAADITPGREVFGSVAGQYGLAFPLPQEPWHAELAGGGGGSVTSGGGGVSMPFSGGGGVSLGGITRRPGLSPAQRQAKKAFGRAQRGAHRGAGRAVRHEQTMLRRRRAWPRQQHESTLALAELTESPLDDITELERWEGVLEGKLRRARKAGKTGRVTELAQELAGVRSSIGSLKESMDANTDAQAEQTQALIDAENARAEALRELTAEVKRGNDLTERIANTEAPVLKQALADAVSGSIGGRVLRGLGTPAFAGGGMTY